MSIASYAEVRDMVIRGDNGINQYCIIAVDEFSFEDYPIYAVDRNEAISLIDRTNMQRVLEVYNYQQDLEEQFKEFRTWRI